VGRIKGLGLWGEVKGEGKKCENLRGRILFNLDMKKITIVYA
jgi:hypothetical protein